jgi:hypothetical protein
MLRPTPILAALLFISAPLFSQPAIGQQPSQSSVKTAPAVTENRVALPPQELAKLTARTNLVLVPVIVTDKSGKHVSGLQKDAFRIEENGSVRDNSGGLLGTVGVPIELK